MPHQPDQPVRCPQCNRTVYQGADGTLSYTHTQNVWGGRSVRQQGCPAKKGGVCPFASQITPALNTPA